MNKLVHAGIFRLKNSKVFLRAILAISFFTIFGYSFIYYKTMQSSVKASFDPIIFNFLIIIGIVTAIFISFFVGTEYSNGTIRNKLIVGFPRIGIYLASLITCILGEMIIVGIAYIVGIIIGFPLFGAPESTMLNMITVGINGIFLSLAYVAIFHMVAMISSSKTNSAVICILLSFFMFFMSVSIFSKLSGSQYIEEVVYESKGPVVKMIENPYYLSGEKRDVYELVLDLLPSGQAMKISNQSAKNNGEMMLYSIIIIIIPSVAGSVLFSRKEIK